MDWLAWLIQFLEKVPFVGHIVAIILSVVTFLPAVVTGLVVVWHAVVAVVGALSAIPGLQGLAGIAAALKVSQAVVDADSNILLAWINRVSAIQPPAA